MPNLVRMADRSPSLILRTGRAGTPATTVHGSTFLVTIACGSDHCAHPTSTSAAKLAPAQSTQIDARLGRGHGSLTNQTVDCKPDFVDAVGAWPDEDIFFDRHIAVMIAPVDDAGACTNRSLYMTRTFRPTITSSATVQSSRIDARSEIITREPIVEPAYRTAFAPTMLLAPIVSGPGGASCRVVLPVVRGGRPRTAPSKMQQSSPTVTFAWIVTKADLHAGTDVGRRINESVHAARSATRSGIRFVTSGVQY